MKIRVRAKPNSRTEELDQEGDSFIIKVREPSREGKANQAIIKLLARYFSVSQNQVRILSGFRSKNKVVEVLEDR